MLIPSHFKFFGTKCQIRQMGHRCLANALPIYFYGYLSWYNNSLFGRLQ